MAGKDDTPPSGDDSTRLIRAGGGPRPLPRTVGPAIQRGSTVLIARAADLYDHSSAPTYGRAGLEAQAALREALAMGQIDVVATDHAPHLLREKEGGALKAASGMPMIQFSLVSMLELSDQGYFPVERVVQLMSHNPALLYHIDRRGFIRPGYYADLVLVDPTANWQVMSGRYYTKCGWTPMDERTFKWRVRRTIINGKTVYADGIVVDGIRGMELKFNP